MPAHLSDTELDQAADIIAWFVALVHAWQRNDFGEAGKAKAELDSRGVRVKFARKLRAGKEAVCNG